MKALTTAAILSVFAMTTVAMAQATAPATTPAATSTEAQASPSKEAAAPAKTVKGKRAQKKTK